MRLYTWFMLTLLFAMSLSLGGCAPAIATQAPAASSPAASSPAASAPAAGTPEVVRPDAAYLPAVSGAQPGEPGYVAPVDQAQAGYPPAADQQATAYPGAPEAQVAGPGKVAAGAQAPENRMLVTAQLIEQTADQPSAGLVRLRVKVLSSKKLWGPLDFTADLVNREALLYARAADVPALKAGERFEAKVAFSGNENATPYVAAEFKILK